MCLGARLLAVAAGGTAHAGSGEPRIGWGEHTSWSVPCASHDLQAPSPPAQGVRPVSCVRATAVRAASRRGPSPGGTPPGGGPGRRSPPRTPPRWG
ncbi:hypothetical protein [Streptomyces sp. cf386]|uniref:hypothetical protein n=1 Tax=Streptomyces sp. cf386 TaxID=1761904 RepID=UPI00210EF77D|nr:hypothetical protein [Streptomyces sp. cf386]